jgi:hypothetical protein
VFMVEVIGAIRFDLLAGPACKFVQRNQSPWTQGVREYMGVTQVPAGRKARDDEAFCFNVVIPLSCLLIPSAALSKELVDQSTDVDLLPEYVKNGGPHYDWS